MIIDCHAHIFPEAMAENRTDYFHGEPEFKLLYDSKKARIAGAEALLSEMDASGVDVSVVFGFPWRNSELFKMHNDYVLESVNRFPDRLKGFGCFDVFHGDAPREADRCLKNGLSGIGELAFYGSGIDENALDSLDPIMAVCRERNLPVMIHANEPVGHHYPGKSPMTLAQTYETVKRFSENKIILAHWGGGLLFFHLCKREVKETLQNVFFDTAASPYLYDAGIYRIASEIAGPEKILLGSDWPLLKPSRYLREMKKSGLPEDHAEKISGKNAARLFEA